MRFIANFNPASFADSTVSLLGAFILGALIGSERQYRQRTAGIRTNALVALGAAAFVDLAQRIAGDVDSLKVIAYVVSGVGFLGAGAIIKDGASVRGMNTAATLWCSAAVGSCTGSDMMAEGALLAFFVIAGNTALRLFVPFIQGLSLSQPTDEASSQLYVEIIKAECSRIHALIEDFLSKAGFPVYQTSFTNETVEKCVIQVTFQSSDNTKTINTLVSSLMNDPAVVSCRSVS